MIIVGRGVVGLETAYKPGRSLPEILLEGLVIQA